MRINLFRLVSNGEIEYDERISEEQKNISVLMLLFVRIAFSATLLIDIFNDMHMENNYPVLYYTLFLIMSIEPLFRCFRGAYAKRWEIINDILIGCIVVGTCSSSLYEELFGKTFITVIFSIITAIVMYFIYVLAFNFYLKKQNEE